MSIVNWFDIHDADHLRAWSHLCQTGAWPEGFIPEGTKFDIHWQIQISARMAEAWVSYALSAGTP